jgi:hypothetical protein
MHNLVKAPARDRLFMSELTTHVTEQIAHCTMKCEHKRRDFVPDVQVVFLQGSSGFNFFTRA